MILSQSKGLHKVILRVPLPKGRKPALLGGHVAACK